LRSGDDIAGVAQPNELFLWHAEDLRKYGVQAYVNARECDEWQFISEFGWMQTSVGVTSESAVIRVDDGFHQAHDAILDLALTECPGSLRSSDEKVDQAAQEMEAEDNNHPDQFFNAIETFVGDGMDKHPNPKDARGKGESPKEYD
jgi:hypothetical protein